MKHSKDSFIESNLKTLGMHSENYPTFCGVPFIIIEGEKVINKDYREDSYKRFCIKNVLNSLWDSKPYLDDTVINMLINTIKGLKQ